MSQSRQKSLSLDPTAPIQIFCDNKGLSGKLRQAFLSYCKDFYASRYGMNSNGDTIDKIVSQITEEEINDVWMEFIRDMKDITPSTNG